MNADDREHWCTGCNGVNVTVSVLCAGGAGAAVARKNMAWNPVAGDQRDVLEVGSTLGWTTCLAVMFLALLFPGKLMPRC